MIDDAKGYNIEVIAQGAFIDEGCFVRVATFRVSQNALGDWISSDAGRLEPGMFGTPEAYKTRVKELANRRKAWLKRVRGLIAFHLGKDWRGGRRR